jgi:hypothetical protein
MAAAGIGRRRRTSRAAPLVQLALAVVAIVAFLPSALRPPQQNPPGAPQLSPDAPPDENVDSIVASFEQGKSSTAGSGAGAGSSGPGGPGGPPPSLEQVADVPPRKPRSCPGGFGEPPRQVESLYAPPCAPQWIGDNGGATAVGVTPTEVRLVWTSADSAAHTWKISDEPQPGESRSDRANRVFLQYFNSRFQLYGRRLVVYQYKYDVSQFYALPADSQRALAVQMAKEANPFAFVGYTGLTGAGESMYDEFSRRGIVNFGSFNYSDTFYNSRSPFSWSWHPSGTLLSKIGAEYVCKKLQGHNAEFAGDEASPAQHFRQTPRRFGLLMEENSATSYSPGRDLLAALKGCNVEPVVVSYDPAASDGDAAKKGLAAQTFKNAGVTSVLVLASAANLVAITKDATRQLWYPEWVNLGFGGLDKNVRGESMDKAQWPHAFGVSPAEMARPNGEQDWYKAYREMDPEGEITNSPFDVVGVDGAGIYLFHSMLQLVSAIQRAGPNLTAKTLQAALFASGKRPNDPLWSIGGGYGPGDYTYGDDVVEFWWDPEAYDPVRGGPGAYRYTNKGRRFGVGKVTNDTSQLFTSGDSTAS